jgi:hypothetical protein
VNGVGFEGEGQTRVAVFEARRGLGTKAGVLVAAGRIRIQDKMADPHVSGQVSLDIIPYWLIPWAFGLIKEGV